MSSAIPPWLPNAISVFRIALIPLWGVAAELCRGAVVEAEHGAATSWRAVALILLITIGVSDLVDGYLARRFGLATRLGATLDAVADKLAQVALLLFFTLRGAPAFPDLPLWFLTVVFGRDLLLATGWLLLWGRIGRVEVEHRAHGKGASVLFFALLVLSTADALVVAIPWLMWAITVVVLFSTMDYVAFGFRQLGASRS
jgi:phosphatidylglycerophosphate synthase